jgi:hypothetical protein
MRGAVAEVGAERGAVGGWRRTAAAGQAGGGGGGGMAGFRPRRRGGGGGEVPDGAEDAVEGVGEAAEPGGLLRHALLVAIRSRYVRCVVDTVGGMSALMGAARDEYGFRQRWLDSASSFAEILVWPAVSKSVTLRDFVASLNTRSTEREKMDRLA